MLVVQGPKPYLVNVQMGDAAEGSLVHAGRCFNEDRVQALTPLKGLPVDAAPGGSGQPHGPAGARPLQPPLRSLLRLLHAMPHVMP